MTLLRGRKHISAGLVENSQPQNWLFWSLPRLSPISDPGLVTSTLLHLTLPTYLRALSVIFTIYGHFLHRDTTDGSRQMSFSCAV